MCPIQQYRFEQAPDKWLDCDHIALTKMTLPRYLYSINDSMASPLLAVSRSSVEHERELEDTIAGSPVSKTHDSSSADEALDLDGDTKFGKGVELGTPGETNVYSTSARLAALKAKEDEEDLLLAGMQPATASNNNNFASQGDAAYKYGSYNDSPSFNKVPYRNGQNINTSGKCVSLKYLPAKQ